jgi:hypothetical protein
MPVFEGRVRPETDAVLHWSREPGEQPGEAGFRKIDISSAAQKLSVAMASGFLVPLAVPLVWPHLWLQKKHRSQVKQGGLYGNNETPRVSLRSRRRRTGVELRDRQSGDVDTAKRGPPK